MCRLRLVQLGLSGPFLVSVLCGFGEGYRPYFENYTVDASIFRRNFRVVSL